MQRKILTEDILSIRSVSDAQISSDGKAVAFVVSDVYKDVTKYPRSNIWIAELDESKRLGEPSAFAYREVQTHHLGTDFFPRWSPDGSQLAFLSDSADGEKFQIYLVWRGGNEVVQLTDVKGEIGISAFAPIKQSITWLADGKEIAFLMWDPPGAEEVEKRKKKDDAIEYEKNHKFCRIWTLDVSTREIRKRTGDYQVWEFDWSMDENKFAALISDEPYEWSWYIRDWP